MESKKLTHCIVTLQLLGLSPNFQHKCTELFSVTYNKSSTSNCVTMLCIRKFLKSAKKIKSM